MKCEPFKPFNSDTKPNSTSYGTKIWEVKKILTNGSHMKFGKQNFDEFTATL